MGHVITVVLWFTLVVVSQSLKLSKARMMEYFQYANVTAAQIDDLVSNVSQYREYDERRWPAALLWINETIITVRHQYYEDQEKRFGNDLMYSFFKMYTNYMEGFNFTYWKMDILKDEQETLLPQYSTYSPTWRCYPTVKWGRLYEKGYREVEPAPGVAIFRSLSLKETIFKELLDEMNSLL